MSLKFLGTFSFIHLPIKCSLLTPRTSLFNLPAIIKQFKLSKFYTANPYNHFLNNFITQNKNLFMYSGQVFAWLKKKNCLNCSGLNFDLSNKSNFFFFLNGKSQY